MWPRQKASLRLIFGGFIVLMLVTFVLEFVTLQSTRTTSDLTVKLHRHSLVISNELHHAQTDIATVQKYMKDVALARSEAQLDRAVAAIEDADAELRRHFDTVAALMSEDRRKIEEVQRAFEAWVPIRQQVIELIRAGNPQEAAATNAGGGTQLAEELNQGMSELVAAAQRQALRVLDDTKASNTAARRLAYWYILLTVAAGGLIAFWVINGVHQAYLASNASQARLEKIAETMSDWIWEMGPDLKVTFVSERYQEITGSGPDEVLGKTREELAGADAQAPRWQAHLKTLAAGKPFRDFRYQWRGKDGNVHHIQTSGTPVIDQQGTFQGYIGTANDITEQVQREERDRATIDRLAVAIEAVEDPFSLWDPEDRLVLANQRFRELNPTFSENASTELTFSEFLLSGLAKGLFPDAAGHENAWFEKRLQHHRAPSHPFEIRLHDGKVMLVREHRLANGYTLTITTDITEVKRSEHLLRVSESRLRQAQRIAKIGNWEIDLRTGRHWGSEEALRIFGLTRDDVACDITGYAELGAGAALFLKYIHPADRDDFLTMHRKALAGDGDYDFDCRIVQANGRNRHLHLSAEMDTDDFGAPYRLYGIVQDRTEQKRLEDQLRQAQKMEAVGQLTGGVAHDFNNLLAVIVGNIDLLLDDSDLDEAVRQRLSLIMGSAKRGADLTHQLLAFSRKQVLSPKTVAINKLIEGMQRLLHSSLPEEIELNLEIHTSLVTVDPHQFENALLNLVLNARDAMPNGGVVTITARDLTVPYSPEHTDDQMPDGDYVIIEVRDTGDGISAKDLPNIFEPFYTTKGIGAGSGLGLSMVYGFIKQSHGHVEVTSKPGQGTTVTICLPRVSESAAESPPGVAAQLAS